MNLFTSLAAAVLLSLPVTAPSLAGDPPKKPVKTYTIEQFMKTVRFGGADLSPDEKTVLYSSNQDGIFNLYEVPFAGGAAKQLTHSKTESLYTLGYLPNGRILYAADQGGNELTHIYLRTTDGVVTDLTPGTVAKNQYSGLSHDRKGFFSQSNARNKAAFDLYEMDLATMKPRLLYENPGGFFPGDVSPDRRYVALTKPVTTTNSDVYLYDTQAKTTKNLTPHEGEVASSPQEFSPDGSKLLIQTNAGSEFGYVTAYDLKHGDADLHDCVESNAF